MMVQLKSQMVQNLDQLMLSINLKSKPSAVYETAEHTIKTWGRKGTSNGIMGIWGEFVSVDYDICIADGGCLEACPVGVYEWFDSPGNPGSEQKPLMSKEPDCIFCLACEGVCPPQAIKIYEAKITAFVATINIDYYF